MLMKGTRTWIIMLIRLIGFTIPLAPGWYKLVRYWLFSPLIIRNLQYGRGVKYRNMLDLYLPKPNNPFDNNTGWHHNKKNRKNNVKKSSSDSGKHQSTPVVIFVSGGAWIIGYKLWSALVARGLAALGILVVVPDYRNFPQGDICDMMEDVALAVQWTVANAARFGGDPERIILAGQSAGAHICLSMLVSEFLARKNFGLINDDQVQTQTSEQSNNESCDPSLALNTPPPHHHCETPRATTPNIASQRSCCNSSNKSMSCSKRANECIDEMEQSMHLLSYAYEAAPAPASPLTGGNVNEWRFSRSRAESHHASMPFTSPPRTRGDTVSYDSCRANSISTTTTTVVESKKFNGNIKDGEALCAEPIDDRSYNSTVKNGYTTSAEIGTNDWVSLHGSSETDSDNIKNIVSNEEEEEGFVTLDHVKMFIGVSGPYDLIKLQSHLHERGLDSSILHWICNGDVLAFSPTSQLRAYAETMNSDKKCLSDFPPVALIHGSCDASIPTSICTELADLLQLNGAKAESRIYEGWSHTDAILEAPLSGCGRLFRDMKELIEIYLSDNNINQPKNTQTVTTNPVPIIDSISASNNKNDTIISNIMQLLSFLNSETVDEFFDDNIIIPNNLSNKYTIKSTEMSNKILPGNRKSMVPKVLVTIARKFNPF